MNRLLVVWTLRRGIVAPPQPLDAANQAAADAATAIHQLERDKPLAQFEWNEEEVYRSRYVRKNRRIG